MRSLRFIRATCYPLARLLGDAIALLTGRLVARVWNRAWGRLASGLLRGVRR